MHNKISFPTSRLGSATKRALTALLIVAVWISPADAILGVTLNVDSLADDPAKSACTDSPGDCSLRGAIMAANAGVGYYTVVLPAGVFYLKRIGTDEDLNATGDLDLRRGMTIRGAGAASTIIDGLEADRVFHVIDVAGDVRFEDLAIRNGSTTGPGGGILHEGDDLTLDSCRVTTNAASGGGGIQKEGSGTLTINDSFIIDNRSDGNGGGIVAGGHVRINDTWIAGNEADRWGGGILLGPGGDLVITRSDVFANTAGEWGGGLMVWLSGLTLIESRVTFNRSRSSGGGIYLLSPVNTEIRSSTIYFNTAEGSGGGLYLSEGRVTILNTTIAENRAYGLGGGIYSSETRLNISFCTITRNISDSDSNGTGDGGGVASSSFYERIKYTILAENEDRGGEAPNCAGELEIFGENLIDDLSGCFLSGTGTAITGLSPRLGPFGLHGYETGHYPLERGSPAVDACTDCLDLAGDPVGVDQRGVRRPHGGRCDLGSYELIQLVLPPVLDLLLVWESPDF